MCTLFVFYNVSCKVKYLEITPDHQVEIRPLLSFKNGIKINMFTKFNVNE